MIYLGNQPIGVGIKSNSMINRVENIDSIRDNEVWTRPQDWPDIPSLNLTMSGDDFIYMVYDKNHEGRFIQWNLTTADGNAATVDIGYISDGAFVVDETQSVSSGNEYFREMDDLEGYVVVRITGQIATCYATTVTYQNRVQQHRMQPLLERIAWIPHMTKFNSAYSSQAWGVHSLQHEVVANGEDNALTSLYYAYNGCYELRSLDISGLYTQNVTNCSNVFNSCRGLRELDLKHWDMSNVTAFNNMFYECRNLKILDLRGWDTGKATDFSGMFYNCRSLKTILGLENFDTSLATNLSTMFSGCESIENLSIENFNTGNVTTILGIFQNCACIQSLDLSKWNVNKLTNLNSAFYGCSSLKRINFNNWQTGTLVNINSLFRDCEALEQPNLSWLKVTSSCTGIGYVFYHCRLFKSLALDWDVSGVVSTNNYSLSIFTGCYSLENITGIKNWDFTHTGSIASLFADCWSLKTIDVSDWDVSTVNSLSALFQNCYSLQELNLSNWRPANCTTYSNMFNGCRSLKSIGDISNFDTSKTTSLANMFTDCYSLREFPDIEDWDVSKVTTTVSMFSGCAGLTEITLKNWNLAACTTIATMFRYCYNLKKATLTGWLLPKLTTTSPSGFLADCNALRDLTIDLPIKLAYSYANTANLSHESVLDMLDNLPTITTARVLTLPGIILNSLLDTEKAIATNKGWTLAS